MGLYVPEYVNLYVEMKKKAKAEPNKVILEDLSGSLTYSKFLINVNVLSKRIKEVTIGEENVGVYLPNVLAQVVTLFSLFKNEQHPCLLNFTMGTDSLIDCVETASLKTVLTSRQFIKQANLSMVVDELEKKVKVFYLEDLKETIRTSQKLTGFLASKMPSFKDKKQGKVILFTSGTESKPKGVVLTHRNFYANIQQALSQLELKEDERVFNPLPLFHSFGLTVGAFLPLVSGVPGFLYPTPLHYKEIPKWIAKKKATIAVGTPTFFDHYGRYASKEDFASLRIVIAGAEKLQDDVSNKYKEKFDIDILQGYGATEAAPIIAMSNHNFNKRGSVGKIVPLMEYKIEKVEGIEKGGSLLVKGPNIMEGYLIHGKGFIPCPEWYNTGDIVEFDEEGMLYIVSRLKRFSKIAGEMVSLNKVEELALQCFGTSNFCAVSVMDKKKGEKIVLFTSEKDVSEKVFRKFIKQAGVSSLHIPNTIEYIEELPILGTGKANYRELEEMAKNIKKGLFS